MTLNPENLKPAGRAGGPTPDALSHFFDDARTSKRSPEGLPAFMATAAAPESSLAIMNMFSPSAAGTPRPTAPSPRPNALAAPLPSKPLSANVVDEEQTPALFPRSKWEQRFVWSMGAVAFVMLAAFTRLQFVNLTTPRPYMTSNKAKPVSSAAPVTAVPATSK